jgi:Rrf2 family protein
VYIPAKSDYALRAMAVLATADGPLSADAVASAQGLPTDFLRTVLNALQRAGLLTSRRGTDGGYRLARPADAITAADVLRAVSGPLAEVRGLRPEDAEGLQPLWVAVRAALRSVLEHVTIADLAAGRLPRAIQRLVDDPDAWTSR